MGSVKDVDSKWIRKDRNAVAPPVESDDDEYETDGDDDSQDDDIVSVDENEPVETEAQEEYDEDEDDEYEDEQPRGFGLVGMLSRALDSEQNRYEDSQSHEEEQEQEDEDDQFERDEVVDLNPIPSTSLSTGSFHLDLNTIPGTSLSTQSFYSDSFQGLDEPYTDIDMHEEDNHQHASHLEQALHFPERSNEEPEEKLAADPTPARVKYSSEKRRLCGGL
jgi:hypothetical protein